MRRAFIPAVVAGVFAALLGGVAGAQGASSVSFTDQIVGAQISATQAVFKVHDSVFGNGAGVQTVKVKGLSGTDREITYYAGGTATSVGSFTLTAPNSSGISTLTGKGHDVSGTGKGKGLKSTYTYTGTFNTKTLVFTVVLKGKYSMP